MVKKLSEKVNNAFQWIDVIDPPQGELQQIAREYNLHESSVNDCLQPDHLPKFEKLENYTFIIFRMHTPEMNGEADTVQELTDKLALFVSKDTIITIRKKDWFPLNQTGKSNLLRRVVRRDPLPARVLLRMWWNCWAGFVVYPRARRLAHRRRAAVR